jgi:hypothetical protein
MSCIDSIKQEKNKLSEQSNDPFEDLRKMQEAIKNKKKDKNT